MTERDLGQVGVSENIIEASWEALVDSVEYKLFREEDRKQCRSGSAAPAQVARGDRAKIGRTEAMDKNYDPQAIEEKWYATWMERGCSTVIRPRAASRTAS